MRATTSIWLLFVVAGCAGAAKANAPSPTVERKICPESVIDLPERWELADRHYVPYSPTVIGVENEYVAGHQQLQVTSGGYLDELTEAYDGLEPRASQHLRAELAADVSTVRHLGSEVWVATWREPQLAVPCDARAVIGQDLDEAAFRNALSHLDLRERP